MHTFQNWGGGKKPEQRIIHSVGMAAFNRRIGLRKSIKLCDKGLQMFEFPTSIIMRNSLLRRGVGYVAHVPDYCWAYFKLVQ